MIKIDGKTYLGVTSVFDPRNPPRHLVTYTVDGDPSSPLYTEHGSSDTELAQYLEDGEVGTIRNLRLWRLDKDETESIKGSILGKFA